MLKFIMLFVVGFINYWVCTRSLFPAMDFGVVWEVIFIITGLAVMDTLYLFWVFGGSISADGIDFDFDIPFSSGGGDCGGCDCGGCDGGGGG